MENQSVEQMSFDEKLSIKDKIFQLDGEIKVVDENIKNNIAAIKELQELKKTQLSELKKLFKNEKITKKEFNNEQKTIKKNIKKNIDEIYEELTYNTSFIVQKYEEWAELNNSDFGKELHSIYKSRRKELKDKIKQEKILEKDKIDGLINEYRVNDVRSSSISRLKKMKRQISKKIEDKHKRSLKQINKQVKTTKRSARSIVVITLLSLLIPITLTASLLGNYLYFYPATNDGKQYDLSNQDLLAGFIISMFLIAVLTGFVAFVLIKSTKRLVIDRDQKMQKIVGIGFVASFFDILGVGSFATTLGQLKATKSIKDDKLIPGTLNMGLAIPIMIEAILMTSAVKVDILTLVVLVVCSVIGSYIGATLVNKVNTQLVKLIMGICLAIVAVIMILTHPDVNILKTSDGSKGLEGWKLAVGAFVFLGLGVLMSFGVGLYAPAMAVVVLLGMDFQVVFPIMMCSSALIMPMSSIKFLKDNNYMPKTSLGLTIGAIVGSQISFAIFYLGVQGAAGVEQADFSKYLTWVAVAVIFYSSFTMLYEYAQNRKKEKISKSLIVHIDEENIVDNLEDASSSKERAQIINDQIENIVDNYSNDNIDTKQRVEDENIPTTEWIKND